MATHTITFQPSNRAVTAPTGSLVVEALREAGLDIARRSSRAMPPFSCPSKRRSSGG
ncbi:MAG: 2Fe-2S iron-sulfur cluster binding domain-containing protein [Chloroflexi bacterium]|nr:2Fe-2S iron-sulfur cluster binding domain-containing protein [Chloroflexota bacterium]